MTTTVAFRSIGCRTNQQELTELSFKLKREGFQIAGEEESADIIVVNSCCVTATAETKTRRMIQSITRKSPTAKVCVTGCCAQLKPGIFNQPNVAWVVGNDHKTNIPAILKSGIMQPDASISTDSPQRIQPFTLSPEDLDTAPLTRLPVKIQEGCDCTCAYCIVPLVRGPSRSVLFKDLSDLISRAALLGCREIILSGTHIGQYRSENCRNIADLLKRILEIPGDFRIRLSSLDPRELSDDILDLVATHSRVCRHLHLSVQSLDSGVLRAMNRPSAGHDICMTTLMRFRTDYPDVSLGGDFIVGFPGETDRAFQNTLERAEAIGFTYGHVFPFSRRPGTAADSLTGQLAVQTKKTRAAALSRLLDIQNKKFYERFIDSVQTIVAEELDPIRGITSNYLRVEADRAGAVKRSALLRVRLTGVVNAKRRFIRAKLEQGLENAGLEQDRNQYSLSMNGL